MSKKTLDVASITNELAGASLYFTQSPPPLPKQESEIDTAVNPTEDPKSESPVSTPIETTIPSPPIKENKASNQSRSVASTHASKQASNQHSQNDHIESIRKIIKQVG